MGEDDKNMISEKSIPKIQDNDGPKQPPTGPPRVRKLPPRFPTLSSYPWLSCGPLKTPELSSGPPEAPELAPKVLTMITELALGASQQVPELPHKVLNKYPELLSRESSGPSSGPPSFRSKLPTKCPKFKRTVPQPMKSNSESSHNSNNHNVL